MNSDSPKNDLASQYDQERQFLKTLRSHDEELAGAGRVFLESVRAAVKLKDLGDCVTVFGSARFPSGHPHYQLAREIGAELARSGYTVVTGGGPGIMEAANRGAKDVNGRSIGCNIRLPMEQQPNPYVDEFVEFDHFFVRKVMLVRLSQAFIVMPGGFGTLDEAFEALTLMQTEKIESFPVIVMGKGFWDKLREFIDVMVEQQTISPEDIELFTYAETPVEALEIIRTHTS